LKYGIFNSEIYFQGESINLLDLLFGMMLPSGNDAATVISEGLGMLLFLEKRFEVLKSEYDLE
jgi:D-alanyl-D-alanine carboxypeptidase